jgi:hypothetical protein
MLLKETYKPPATPTNPGPSVRQLKKRVGNHLPGEDNGSNQVARDEDVIGAVDSEVEDR